MRKIATSLFALTLCAGLQGSVSAATIMTENFNYAAGNLVPNNSWANYSGAITDIQVVSEIPFCCTAYSRVSGYGPNANDDHKLFPAQPTTSKTYACFEVTIPAIAGDLVEDKARDNRQVTHVKRTA